MVFVVPDGHGDLLDQFGPLWKIAECYPAKINGQVAVEVGPQMFRVDRDCA